MEPVIKELEKEYPDLKIEKIDVEKKSEEANKYAVMGLPTFIFLDGNKEVARETGTVTKDKLVKHIK